MAIHEEISKGAMNKIPSTPINRKLWKKSIKNRNIIAVNIIPANEKEECPDGKESIESISCSLQLDHKPTVPA